MLTDTCWTKNVYTVYILLSSNRKRKESTWRWRMKLTSHIDVDPLCYRSLLLPTHTSAQLVLTARS